MQSTKTLFGDPLASLLGDRVSDVLWGIRSLTHVIYSVWSRFYPKKKYKVASEGVKIWLRYMA
jgi:hypothetical protein